MRRGSAFPAKSLTFRGSPPQRRAIPNMTSSPDNVIVLRSILPPAHDDHSAECQGTDKRSEEMKADLDVNYLLHRQQVSLICAQRASSVEGRAAYEGLARGYTDELIAYRRENQREPARVR
jgi:hypothetical protein